MKNNMISIKDLTVRANGKPILENINLEIAEGESLGILGRSGSGKSTLLHLLRGYHEFNDIEGEIRFNIARCEKCGRVEPPSTAGQPCHCNSGTLKPLNLDYLATSEEQRSAMERTAIMLQRTFALYGDETVLENVMRSLASAGIPKHLQPKLAMELIEQVRLNHRVMYTGKELSGGEKQRVVLAVQLAKSPMLLLADEPTGTLDPTTSRLIHDSITRARSRHNITMLITSHLPEVVTSLTHRAILLEKGEITLMGESGEVAGKFKATTGSVKESQAVTGRPIIRVQDVKKSYHSHYKGLVKAVDGVTLEVYEGEIFGIIGTSGAGKTTLSKIIAGLMEPKTGRVDVRIGDTWVDMREKGHQFRGRARPHIGYLHQEYSLYPYRTILYNLTESIGLKLPPEIAERKARQVLLASGFNPDEVEEVLRKTPYQLSVGERHRATMAQALMKEPSIVIFDEPTGTMDPVTKNMVANSILTAREKTGTTFVIVSHDMDFVKHTCDRAALMELGKIKAMGKTDTVLHHLKGGEKSHHQPTNLADLDFYISHALELGQNLDLKEFQPTYQEGIQRCLNEARRYAEEGMVYEMDAEIRTAQRYASRLGIELDIRDLKPVYERGIREALDMARQNENTGFLGAAYQYIERAENYASRIGLNIEEILKKEPWYERWSMSKVKMRFGP